MAGSPEMSRHSDFPHSPEEEIGRTAGRERARDPYAAERDAARRLHGNRRRFAPLLLSLAVFAVAGLVWLPLTRGLSQRVSVAQLPAPLEQTPTPPQPDTAGGPRIPQLGLPLPLAEVAPRDDGASADPTAPEHIVAASLTVPQSVAPDSVASQPPSPPPAAASAVAPPAVPDTKPAAAKAASASAAAGISPEEVRRLMARASELIALADIAGARLLLTRAVSSGDARAIFALAETYDPNMLSAWGVRGIKGDRERASALYAQAHANGLAEAQSRVTGLH